MKSELEVIKNRIIYQKCVKKLSFKFSEETNWQEVSKLLKFDLKIATYQADLKLSRSVHTFPPPSLSLSLKHTHTKWLRHFFHPGISSTKSCCLCFWETSGACTTFRDQFILTKPKFVKKTVLIKQEIIKQAEDGIFRSQVNKNDSFILTLCLSHFYAYFLEGFFQFHRQVSFDSISLKPEEDISVLFARANYLSGRHREKKLTMS